MKLEIKVKCNLCGSVYVVFVDSGRYNKWIEGEGFIQDIMPELTPEERELLISQTCDSCFDIIFNLGEDNE